MIGKRTDLDINIGLNVILHGYIIGVASIGLPEASHIIACIEGIRTACKER